MLVIDTTKCPNCDEYFPDAMSPKFCPECGIELEWPERVAVAHSSYAEPEVVMRKGVITCKCGQLFGFETAAETVKCPNCKVAFVAAQYEVVEPDPEPEPEVTEDGTDI